jgi:hypothetical protein
MGGIHRGDEGATSDEAGRIRERGTVLYVVASFEIRGLASTPQHAFYFDGSSADTFQIMRNVERAVNQGLNAVESAIQPSVTMVSTIVTDTVSGDVQYVNGSASPPAAWNPVTRELVWVLADPAPHVELTYQAVPTRWSGVGDADVVRRQPGGSTEALAAHSGAMPDRTATATGDHGDTDTVAHPRPRRCWALYSCLLPLAKALHALSRVLRHRVVQRDRAGPEQGLTEDKTAVRTLSAG